jgi:hypothetical protein
VAVYRILSAVIALFLLPCAVEAQSLTPREIAAQARPAVVLIKAKADGTVLGQGSGFIVDPAGVVVTNLHVIRGADALEVQLATGEVYDNVFFVSSDARRDVAVLKLPATRLPHLRIGDDQVMNVGDAVYVMGNPMGLEGTFSDGLVSARRTEEGVVYLQITAPISRGSSGGPVLNDRAEVVGIATMVMREGQNLNLAVAARYATGMIAMNERPRPLREARTELAAAPSRPASPASAGAPSRSVEERIASLEPWERSVLRQLLRVDSLGRETGFIAFGDVQLGYLRRGRTESETLTLPAGTYVATGVCDDDCDDLDLYVYNSAGRLLDSDLKRDAAPTVGFNLTQRSQIRLVASMASCSAEPCYYGVRVLQLRR